MSESLPSAPFYGVSEDRPRPPIDPANEITTVLRIRRLLERLEGFFLNDYKFVKDKVEYLEPYTNAKALLTLLREEVHLLDANPGLPPTITEKKILEGEATLGFLERKSRLVIINEIEAYSMFQDKRSGAPAPVAAKAKEGFTSGSSGSKTPATVDDLVKFNIKAYAEIQRLGASGTSDPVTTARISSIQAVRQSVQRILDDIQRKRMDPKDIPIFKEDIEKAFPALGDPTTPLPKLIEKFSLPPELLNLLPPGQSASDMTEEQLIAYYINMILSSTSFSMQFGLDYTAPNKVRLAEANAMTNIANSGILENIKFDKENTKPKLNLTFSKTDGDQVESLVVGPSNLHTTKNGDSTVSNYYPGLDWKARTSQICRQIRTRGMDPRDFGCLEAGEEVSPNYSWRGHAKMVCSRLLATPDPALPETCGCPPAGWAGWKSEYDGDY